MYYRLDSIFPMTDDNTYFDIDDGIEVDGIESWASGIPFIATPPNPIEIEITRVGEDTDSALSPIPFNDQNLCIATPEIIEAIKKCGVNNIQTYPAVLRDSGTATEYPYFAINIIGLIKAANLEKSSWVNLDGEARSDTVFDNLVVDNEKAFALPIFRLLEDTGTIIVNEKIKQALEGFPYLSFHKVA